MKFPIQITIYMTEWVFISSLRSNLQTVNNASALFNQVGKRWTTMTKIHIMNYSNQKRLSLTELRRRVRCGRRWFNYVVFMLPLQVFWNSTDCNAKFHLLVFVSGHHNLQGLQAFSNSTGLQRQDSFTLWRRDPGDEQRCSNQKRPGPPQRGGG